MMLLQPTPSLSGHPMKLLQLGPSWELLLLGTLVALRRPRLS